MTPAPRSVILEPTPGSPMTHMRGSVVANSRLAAERRGLGAVYRERLGPANLAAIEAVVAQSWVPLELARPHYDVLQALTPDPKEQWAVGVLSGSRLQGSYLRTVIRLMQATGLVTPERALGRLRRPFARMMRGGSVGVIQVGPQTAHVFLTEMPLLEVPYFRNGLGGALEGGLQLAAPHIRLSSGETVASDAVTFAATW